MTSPLPRVLLGAWLCLGSLPGRAAEPTEPAPARGYEDERTARVLTERGLEVVPDPAGKRIRRIVIVRHDVFVEDEPWPLFLNALHTMTHEDTVARELLFAEGEVWDQARVDETARKLRDQIIFAMVRIVPVRPIRPAGAPVEADAPVHDAPVGHASTDGEVDVLVFTRDLWSLRLESAFSFNDGRFDQLALTLIERNLLGRNVQAAIAFELLPKTWSLGGLFTDRRILSTRLSLSAGMTLVFARDGSDLEGTRGSVSFGLPLWDLRERWGFTASAGWNETIGRQLSGATLLTWDDPSTADAEAVPRIWYQDLFSASLTASRQLVGDGLIHRLGFGYAASLRSYTPHPDTGLAPGSEAAAAFSQAVLPPSRNQLYPWFAWTMFAPTWATFTELGGYGLTEDVRTGLGLSLSVGLPLEAFGSDVDALTWEASVSYVWAPPALSDRALLDLYAGLYGRLEASQVIDQAYRFRARGASPRLPFGRVVLLVDLEGRVADSANSLVTLGGDNGLRGYPSQYLYAFGGDRARLNLEVRSRPLVVGSVHLGAVAFWDAGGVGPDVFTLPLRHSLGLGLRALLPQFNRFAFRFDLGFPLSGGATALLSFGSSQMVPLTALEDERLAE